MRVETLNNEEVRVLDAVRSLAHSVAQTIETRRTAAQQDLRREIEDVFNLLNNVSSHEWEETVQEARDRLYRLLW